MLIYTFVISFGVRGRYKSKRMITIILLTSYDTSNILFSSLPVPLRLSETLRSTVPPFLLLARERHMSGFVLYYLDFIWNLYTHLLI